MYTSSLRQWDEGGTHTFRVQAEGTGSPILAR